MTEPCWPHKSMKPWLMGRLQCTVVHWPIADMRGESRDVRFLGWSEPMTDGSARSAFGTSRTSVRSIALHLQRKSVSFAVKAFRYRRKIP